MYHLGRILIAYRLGINPGYIRASQSFNDKKLSNVLILLKTKRLFKSLLKSRSRRYKMNLINNCPNMFDVISFLLKAESHFES